MNRVPGIEGDCGGFCACGTCHCYVEKKDAVLLPEMHELERATLDFAYDVEALDVLSGGRCLSVLFVEICRRHDLLARLDAAGTPVPHEHLTPFLRAMEDDYGDNP